MNIELLFSMPGHSFFPVKCGFEIFESNFIKEKAITDPRRCHEILRIKKGTQVRYLKLILWKILNTPKVLFELPAYKLIMLTVG